MTTTFGQLVDHLDELGVKYQADAEKQLVFAIFGGRNAAYQVLVVITDGECLLQVFATTGLRVPPGARPMMAELVTRINFGIKIGKFELDINDGELRYHAATCLSDGLINQDALMTVIGAAFMTFDRYLPAINSLIYANETPLDSLKLVEC